MSASEKDFVNAGAECVGGDLILNRIVVGRYRNGQFFLTEEGMLMEPPKDAPVAPAPTEPAAPAAPTQALKPPRAPRAPKAKPAAPEPTPEPTEPESDPLADLGALGLGDS